MSSAPLELQRAVQARLIGDPTLTALLGGMARVYDHAPADVPFPYISHGRTSVHDWSTATERGDEHLFTLNVWSKARGRAEALLIMRRLRALLDDEPLSLASHHLVSLELEFREVRYDDDLSVYHGLMRFRALTEEIVAP